MLNLSNVQHFSVGDGEGIRTTAFLKGCNLHCPWCHNPENLRPEPVTLRYKATGKTEIRGRLLSAEELFEELSEDRDFYEESGGGVTFSGGEALLQAEELTEVCRLLKEAGISVLVDTAGCVPYKAFQRLNPLISGYLFDFKTADADKYEAIGGSLPLVRENLSRLKADGIPVRIRIPLIPGFNTDRSSLFALCEEVQKLGYQEVDLLPFHRLGSGKYEAMGLDYAYRDQPPLSREELEEIRGIFASYFTVKTEE